MISFDYKSMYQKPSGFACLMLIRAIIAIFTPLGIQNLNKKRKSRILVVVIKRHHHESCLLDWSCSPQTFCMSHSYNSVVYRGRVSVDTKLTLI